MPEFDWIIKSTDDCDVRLGRSERNAVINEPLFFCPDAAAVAADNALGASTIAKKVSAAQVAGIVHRQDRLGRAAIENVVLCRPTSFGRLVNVINVMNFMLIERGETRQVLRSSSIIAAVFRIAEFKTILDDLKIKASEIADVAALDCPLVDSLVANYRLHLTPTLSVLEALRSHPRVASSQWYERLNHTDKRGSIVVDREPRTNVEKIRVDADGRNPVYLLNCGNLSPAPLNGHDWSITAPTQESR